MCSVELVKKTMTGHIARPIANIVEGQRYARQRRFRQTSRPTIASATRKRPSARKPVANSQWTCSGGGIALLLFLRHVLEQAGHDEEVEERRRPG